MKIRQPVSMKSHWDKVYQSHQPEELSWHVAHLDHSLVVITTAVPERKAAIIDVGGGESTLVDDLLTCGYRALTVLDISDACLARARKRLGVSAAWVTWRVADITTATLPAAAYDLWHDRAVFHFLTEAADRLSYVAQIRNSLKPGGHLVMATFAIDGPRMCSDRDVLRYDQKSLHEELGAEFTLLAHEEIDHVTPSHAVQKFIYCTFRFR